MRVSVGALIVAHVYRPDIKIVVHVFVSPGSQFLEELLHVLNEKRFRFVYDYRHGGVEALDIDHSILDSGFLDFLLNLVGNVDEVQGGIGLEFDNVVYDFHNLFSEFNNMLYII